MLQNTQNLIPIINQLNQCAMELETHLHRVQQKAESAIVYEKLLLDLLEHYVVKDTEVYDMIYKTLQKELFKNEM